MENSRGRPRKAPHERRSTNQLSLYANDLEKAALEAAAKRAGLDFSAWARTVLLEKTGSHELAA